MRRTARVVTSVTLVLLSGLVTCCGPQAGTGSDQTREPTSGQEQSAEREQTADPADPAQTADPADPAQTADAADGEQTADQELLAEVEQLEQQREDSRRRLIPVLLARPPLEQVQRRHTRMATELTSRLSRELGPFRWRDDITGGEPAMSCRGEFLSVEGASALESASLRFDGSITDARWPRAVAIAAAVGREYGFEAPEVAVDQPGFHEVRGHDGDGGYYVFGTAAHTDFTIYSGCYLPEAQHKAAARQHP